MGGGEVLPTSAKRVREALPTPKKGGGEILPKKVGERSGVKRERARGIDEKADEQGARKIDKKKRGGRKAPSNSRKRSRKDFGAERGGEMKRRAGARICQKSRKRVTPRRERRGGDENICTGAGAPASGAGDIDGYPERG